MELTWDLVGQYVFLAALFVIIVGLGKSFFAIIAVETHLRGARDKSKEYQTGRRKAISRTVFEGLLEIGVGTAIMWGFIVTGVLDSEGQSIVTVLGVVFLVAVLCLRLAARSYLKGLESSK